MNAVIADSSDGAHSDRSDRRQYMTGGSVVCRAMPITPNVTAHITVAASTNP